jgi:hypothetical protein
MKTPRSPPRNLSIWFRHTLTNSGGRVRSVIAQRLDDNSSVRHPTDKSITDYLLFNNSGSMLSGNCDSIERFARRLLSLIALAPLLFGRLPRPVAFIAGGFLFGQ